MLDKNRDGMLSHLVPVGKCELCGRLAYLPFPFVLLLLAREFLSYGLLNLLRVNAVALGGAEEDVTFRFTAATVGGFNEADFQEQPGESAFVKGRYVFHQQLLRRGAALLGVDLVPVWPAPEPGCRAGSQ